MPPPDIILALHGVQKDYRGLRPLRVRHLEVREGERVALLGFDLVASEVLASLTTGATLPDAGDIHAFGTLTRAVTDADEWLAAMRRFGILSERVVLLESFSVEQNLALPFSLEIDDMPVDIRDKARALAKEVGLEDDTLTRAVGSLAPHVLLRVRLGKALALEPRVLLAEHPNALLSAGETSRFAADLARVAERRRMAVVLTTADLAFARAVSSRVLTLRPSTGELVPSVRWREWLTRG